MHKCTKQFLFSSMSSGSTFRKPSPLLRLFGKFRDILFLDISKIRSCNNIPESNRTVYSLFLFSFFLAPPCVSC